MIRNGLICFSSKENLRQLIFRERLAWHGVECVRIACLLLAPITPMLCCRMGVEEFTYQKYLKRFPLDSVLF